MLVNMFVGQPPGNYDRLLDFSRAVTGTLFFVPPATFLEQVSTGTAGPPIIAPNLAERDAPATSKPSTPARRS